MNDRPRLTPVENLARIPAPPPRLRLEPQPDPRGADSSAPAASTASSPSKPTTRPSPRPEQPRRTSTRASDTAVIIREISFTTPVELRDRLRNTARSSPDTTVAAVVLDAIERNVDDLEALVAGEQPHSRPADHSGLFPDAVKTERTSTEIRVPVTLRLTSANLAVIDDLAQQHRATSRSQLITAALRAHLHDGGVLN